MDTYNNISTYTRDIHIIVSFIYERKEYFQHNKCLEH